MLHSFITGYGLKEDIPFQNLFHKCTGEFYFITCLISKLNLDLITWIKLLHENVEKFFPFIFPSHVIHVCKL